MHESLTTALQALCPRVHLTRMASAPFYRLTVHSRLHELYAWEPVPEPISAATPKELEEVLRRVLNVLACHMAVSAPGPVADVCKALVGVCKASTKLLAHLESRVGYSEAEDELRRAMAAAHEAVARLEAPPVAGFPPP